MKELREKELGVILSNNKDMLDLRIPIILGISILIFLGNGFLNIYNICALLVLTLLNVSLFYEYIYTKNIFKNFKENFINNRRNNMLLFLISNIILISIIHFTSTVFIVESSINSFVISFEVSIFEAVSYSLLMTLNYLLYSNVSKYFKTL